MQSIDSPSERVKEFLSVLAENISLLKEQARLDLSKYSLPVGDFDATLKQAYEIELPKELKKNNHISFYFYDALRHKDTAAAQYIKRRYEEATRDIRGTDSLDVLILLEAVEAECSLIENFLDKAYLGSKTKVLQNLAIWIQLALNHTHTINKEFINSTLSFKEVETSFDEARRAQAIFRIKINALNQDIISAEEAIKRGFYSFGPVFYSKFLSSSVEAESMAKKRSSGNTKRSLVELTDPISNAIELHLEDLTLDQERRIRLYRDKVAQIFESMKRRNIAKSKIWGLSSSGKSVPHSGPGIMAFGVRTDPEEIQFWSNLTKEAPKPHLIGKHSDFSDLLEGDSHSQYLLKAGGKVSGDVALEKRLDGVDVSKHRHTGLDGSKRISGKDIIPKTIKENLVNSEKLPQKPINLTVSRMDLTIVPPGFTIVDTTMMYDSDDDFFHEMEIRLVPAGIRSARFEGVYLAGWRYLPPEDALPWYPAMYYLPTGASEVQSVPLPDGIDYYGEITSGVLASTDEGDALVMLGLDSPSNPEGVIYRSEVIPPQSSEDWEAVELTLPGDTLDISFYNTLATDGETILGIVWGNLGLYEIKSVDSGKSWTASAATGHPYYAWAYSPDKVDRIAFGFGRFYRWRSYPSGDSDFRIDYSTDGGNTWTVILTGISDIGNNNVNVIYMGGGRWTVHEPYSTVFQTVDDFETVSIATIMVDLNDIDSIMELGPNDTIAGDGDQLVRDYSKGKAILSSLDSNNNLGDKANLDIYGISVPDQIALQQEKTAQELFDIPPIGEMGNPAELYYWWFSAEPYRTWARDVVSQEIVYGQANFALVSDDSMTTLRQVRIEGMFYSDTSGNTDRYEAEYYNYCTFGYANETDVSPYSPGPPDPPGDPKIYLFLKKSNLEFGHNRLLMIDPSDPTLYERGYSIPAYKGSAKVTGTLTVTRRTTAAISYVSGVPTIFVLTDEGYIWRTTNMAPSASGDWLPPRHVLGIPDYGVDYWDLEAYESKVRVLLDNERMASSDDGGETWSVATMPDDGSDGFRIIAQNNGLWWRYNDNDGQFTRTTRYSTSTDGTSWTENSVPYLTRIGSMSWMSNGQVGIAANSNAIIATETGGEEWVLYYGNHNTGGITELWGAKTWVDKNDNLFVQSRGNISGSSKTIHRYNAGEGTFTYIATVDSGTGTLENSTFDVPGAIGNNYTLHAYDHSSSSDTRYHYVMANDDTTYTLGFSDATESLLAVASYKDITPQATPTKQWIMPTSRGWTGSFDKVPGEVNPYLNPQTMFTVDTNGKGVKTGDLMILQTAASEYSGFTYPAEWVNIPAGWTLGQNQQYHPFCGLTLYKFADASDEAGTTYDIQLQTTADDQFHQGWGQAGGWTVSVITVYDSFTFGTPEAHWRYDNDLSSGNLTETAPLGGDKTLVISSRHTYFPIQSGEEAWLRFEDLNTKEVWRRSEASNDFSVITGYCLPGDTVEIGIVAPIAEGFSNFPPNAYHMQFLVFVPITLQ